MQRSAALTNHLEIGRVLGVVKATKRAIINAETVFPKMKNSSLYRTRLRSAGMRIGDDLRRSFVTTQCLAATTKSRWSCSSRLSSRTCGVPRNVNKNSFCLSQPRLLSSLLDNIINNLSWIILSVWILNSYSGLLSSRKQISGLTLWCVI